MVNGFTNTVHRIQKNYHRMSKTYHNFGFINSNFLIVINLSQLTEAKTATDDIPTALVTMIPVRWLENNSINGLRTILLVKTKI